MNGRKTWLACGYAAGALGCVLAFASHVQVNGAGSAGVVGGEFVVEPATLINLGFEWYVDGDDNRNATVDVSYRKAGQSSWSTGLPLLRCRPSGSSRDSRSTSPCRTCFAGSILDLEPDTEYEAQFVLKDPDGVSPPQGVLTDYSALLGPGGPRAR